MQYRELTKEEKLQVPGLASQDQLVIGGVNEDGEVEMACGVLTIVHLDPVWVRPGDRKKSGFRLVRLWKTVRNRLYDAGVRAVTASVMEDFPGAPYDKEVEHLAIALAGGSELKARIWLIPLTHAHSDSLGDSNGIRSGGPSGG